MAKRRPFSEERPLDEMNTEELINETEVQEEETDDISEDPAKLETKLVRTIPQLLNVRSFPSQDKDNIVEVVEVGTILTVSDIDGNPDWYRVSNENMADTYVMKSLVEEVK